MKLPIFRLQSIFVALVLLMPAIALAATAPNLGQMLNDAAGASGAGYDTSTNSTLAHTAGLIAEAFISLIGVIFISYTIYGGYLWMTAAGNEENISKAKKIIRDGIIGIIIILSAAAIYSFVATVLNTGTVPGTSGAPSGGS